MYSRPIRRRACRGRAAPYYAGCRRPWVIRRDDRVPGGELRQYRAEVGLRAAACSVREQQAWARTMDCVGEMRSHAETLRTHIDVKVKPEEKTAMLIGELSTRTGVSQRLLRYYEEQGLLSRRATRTASASTAGTPSPRSARCGRCSRQG